MLLPTVSHHLPTNLTDMETSFNLISFTYLARSLHRLEIRLSFTSLQNYSAHKQVV